MTKRLLILFLFGISFLYLHADGCMPGPGSWSKGNGLNYYVYRYAPGNGGYWYAYGLLIGNNRDKFWLTADTKPDSNSPYGYNGRVQSPTITGGIGTITISMSAPNGYAGVYVAIYDAATDDLLAYKVVSAPGATLSFNISGSLYIYIQNYYSNYGEEAPRAAINSLCWTSYSNTPVTGVTVDKSAIVIAEGEQYTLNAIVTPSNATNKAVTWSSASTATATVSGGKVTGVKEGTTTVTVKTSDGGYTATCKVTVIPPPVMREDKVTLCPDALPYTHTWSLDGHTKTVSEAGTYIDTLQGNMVLTSTGKVQDSVYYKLVLDVQERKPNTYDTIHVKPMQSYKWLPNGVTYTPARDTTDSVMKTYTSAPYCDSVKQYLHIIVDYPDSVFSTMTVCQYRPFIWNINGANRGTYSATKDTVLQKQVAAVNAPDTVLTTDVQVIPSDTVRLFVNVQPTRMPYIWNSMTCDTPNKDYIFKTQGENACDSVTIMHLRVTDDCEIPTLFK